MVEQNPELYVLLSSIQGVPEEIKKGGPVMNFPTTGSGLRLIPKEPPENLAKRLSMLWSIVLLSS